MNELNHSPAELKQMYRERFGGNQSYRTAVWRTLTSQFFSQWIAPDATVLDLGCGHCEFINNVAAKKKFGMDLNPDSISMADTDVKILSQDCSSAWPAEAHNLDVVFTSNFFEHLPTKAALELTIREVFSCLKPGGRLIAMGPNIKFAPGEYWDFLDHYVPLTELSTAEALKKNGFVIDVVHARFLPYTMSNSKTYPLWTLSLYLKLPPVWRLFGRQFLVVARKP